MKIIIENLVAKLNGGSEDELPVSSSIRFELDGHTISVKIDKETGGLSIYKSHGLDDTLKITPRSNNKVVII